MFYTFNLVLVLLCLVPLCSIGIDTVKHKRYHHHHQAVTSAGEETVFVFQSRKWRYTSNFGLGIVAIIIVAIIIIAIIIVTIIIVAIIIVAIIIIAIIINKVKCCNQWR